MTRRLNKKSPKSSKPLGKKQNDSFANVTPVWTFRNIDTDGNFAFNPNRKDFDTVDFLNKMIAYSNMTWSAIGQQTHDNGKSKHHFLSETTLSNAAVERIKAKELEDKTDLIFSFALNNTVRVIGIRDKAEFEVIWYDANHKFAISNKKHT